MLFCALEKVTLLEQGTFYFMIIKARVIYIISYTFYIFTPGLSWNFFIVFRTKL
jgi:hypothetical protein